VPIDLAPGALALLGVRLFGAHSSSAAEAEEELRKGFIFGIGAGAFAS
jgi:hypothetical protein